MSTLACHTGPLLVISFFPETQELVQSVLAELQKAVEKENWNKVSEILNNEKTRFIESGKCNLTKENLINGALKIISKDDHCDIIQSVISLMETMDSKMNLDDLKYRVSREIPQQCHLIFYAASNGRHDIVEMLLREMKNISILDKGDQSVLHYAAEYGWIDIAKQTLAKDKDLLDKVNVDDKTALNIAEKFNHKEMVSYFINCGARVVDVNESYFTMADICLRKDWLEIFRKIFQRDKPSKIGDVVRHILMLFEEKYRGYMNVLLDIYPKLLTLEENFRCLHPLLWAIDNKYTKAVECLVLFADSVTWEGAAKDGAQYTFLYYVLMSCRDTYKRDKRHYKELQKIFEILVQSEKGDILLNAEPDAILLSAQYNLRPHFQFLMNKEGDKIALLKDTNSGRNILHFCIINGWSSEFESILDKMDIIGKEPSNTGLDIVNSTDNKGMTLAMKAVAEKRPQIFAKLIKREGTLLTNIDIDGQTVLHHLVDAFDEKQGFSKEHLNELMSKIDKELMNKKDLDIVNHADSIKGMTPIMKAIAQKRPQVYALLVKREGIVLTNVDKNRKTILHHLVEAFNDNSSLWEVHLIELLKSEQTSYLINTPDDESRTPVTLAKELKNDKCIDILEREAQALIGRKTILNG